MRKLIIICGLLGLLASCGQTAPTANPTAPANPPVPAPTLTDPAAQQTVDQAREALAAHTGVAASALTLINAEEQTWSDSSLGCPDPQGAYGQVIVQGYLLVFSDGQQTYPIHTSTDGRPLILCQNGKPTMLETEPGASRPPAEAQPVQTPGGAMANMEQMRDLAIARLAADLGVAESAIAVVVSEPATWSDGSLGCPQPDVSYIQMIIEGYRFVLEADGTQYELHTDSRSSVVRCPAVGMG